MDRSILLDFPLRRRISQWQSQTLARREGECPAPKTNQNTYIIYNSPGDRVYIQTINFRTITPSYQTKPEYRTTDFLNIPSFSFSKPLTYWQDS